MVVKSIIGSDLEVQVGVAASAQTIGIENGNNLTEPWNDKKVQKWKEIKIFKTLDLFEFCLKPNSEKEP
jgi:hypothetical protein